MPQIQTFQIPMSFPLGPWGDSVRRHELEERAKDKLIEGMRARGFEPYQDSFRVEWRTAYKGLIFAMGIQSASPRNGDLSL